MSKKIPKKNPKQQNIGLIKEILSGKLFKNTLKDFELPAYPLDDFDCNIEYRDYWRPLYKYEIYSRLFADQDLG